MATSLPQFRTILQTLVVLAVCAPLFVFGGWLATRVMVAGPIDRVPDLVGLGRAEAEEVLATHGMRAEVDDTPLVREEIPVGAVAQQDPRPGTPVKRVRIVRLMLSAGPRERQLPPLVGEPRSQVVIALQQQDFEVEFVAVAPSAEMPRDAIIAQSPDPAELQPGEVAPLRLLASLGPVTRYYVMPDLVQRRVEDVRPRLEAMGFRVSEGPNRRLVANVPPGVIISQVPHPGFRIAVGGEVLLQVTR